MCTIYMMERCAMFYIFNFWHCAPIFHLKWNDLFQFKIHFMRILNLKKLDHFLFQKGNTVRIIHCSFKSGKNTIKWLICSNCFIELNKVTTTLKKIKNSNYDKINKSVWLSSHWLITRIINHKTTMWSICNTRLWMSTQSCSTFLTPQ